MWTDWDGVAAAARGVKADYSIAGKTIGRGGQASVARAVHRATDIPVAFKRLLPGLARDDDALARMRREVDIGRAYADPHIVPVLDSDPDGSWFVMPLATSRLEDLRDLVAKDDESLLGLVREVCAGLVLPHGDGWTHRDVKPENILRFRDSLSARWAVADWGLGRRPSGATTSPGRTVVGVAYGSEGFAAPEQGVDAHAVTAAADVFSLGQVIGWVLTGRNPQPNIPLLPASGPWRTIVEAATRFAAARRPQSVGEFLELVEAELVPLPDPSISRGEQLLHEAQQGDAGAGVALLQLAAADPDDDELLIQMVPRVGVKVVRLAAIHHAELLAEVLSAIRGQARDHPHLDYHVASRVVQFAATSYAQAVDRRDVGLGDLALETACAWDEIWNQWDPHKSLKATLRVVRGEAAKAAARVLRRFPESAVHFDELADDKRVDPAVRGLLTSLRT